MNAYEVLTGAGTIYVATVGTAFPAVNVTPGAGWTSLGETDGGVKASLTQKIELHTTDQRTGPVKAERTEERLNIETGLVQATLENLAKILGKTVTDTAPGSGTIGTREVTLYRGDTVSEYAVLLRGKSPYGDYNAQYQVPRAFFDGDVEEDKQKGKKVVYKVKIVALEDLNASTSADRFGKVITQDAAAT